MGKLEKRGFEEGLKKGRKRDLSVKISRKYGRRKSRGAPLGACGLWPRIAYSAGSED